MKLYQKKNIDFNFIILCPEETRRLLKSTISCLDTRYPKNSRICVVDKTISNDELKEMNVLCPTFVGQNTFTSLLNTGMKHSSKNWNIFIICGANIRWKLDEKLSYFIEGEKDVLYSILNDKNNFVDSTFNGLTINKSVWKNVGDMADVGDLELIKLLWNIKALEKGIKFKGVVGIRMC